MWMWWGAALVMAVTVSAEPLNGTLQLRGLRWAPEKQTDVEECPLADANRLEMVELVGQMVNRSRNPVWGMTAEVRLRWQEGPDDDPSQALWTPWHLVETRPVAPIPPFTSFQLRTRLDVEGRRLWLKNRRRWPYALQVQLAMRREPQSPPLLLRTATLSIPAPAVGSPPPEPPPGVDD
jgi:hypothetical protein